MRRQPSGERRWRRVSLTISFCSAIWRCGVATPRLWSLRLPLVVQNVPGLVTIMGRLPGLMFATFSPSPAPPYIASTGPEPLCVYACVIPRSNGAGTIVHVKMFVCMRVCVMQVGCSSAAPVWP